MVHILTCGPDTDVLHVVTVGGVTVSGQFLAAVTEESSEFQTDPTDGIMGMGLPALSSLQGVRASFILPYTAIH